MATPQTCHFKKQKTTHKNVEDLLPKGNPRIRDDGPFSDPLAEKHRLFVDGDITVTSANLSEPWMEYYSIDLAIIDREREKT